MLPRTHRLGLATALMRALLEEPARLGIPGVVSVMAHNTASLALCWRLGFGRRGTNPPFVVLEWRAPDRSEGRYSARRQVGGTSGRPARARGRAGAPHGAVERRQPCGPQTQAHVNPACRRRRGQRRGQRRGDCDQRLGWRFRGVHDALSRETVRRRLAEDDLKPSRKDMLCIPHVGGTYVSGMKEVPA